MHISRALRGYALLAAAATTVPLVAQSRVVNAPVAPEAIYIGTSIGDVGNVSVIDLNGFGQGTGDDDVFNAGALPDFSLPPSLIPPATHSGKGLLKNAFGIPIRASFPRFLFVALGDTDRVDVYDLATRMRVTSLQTPGVQCLAHYWRQ